ncbi:MAG: CPBP family glutamic-type intramembrane protease, partial [Gemmatimonadota bacterium]|nr:CPBP family glutamic-type intramembrane protease [Gemmatimonadota bacterium]
GLVLAALLEELLFRGVPLARLAETAGPAAASVALSAAFVTSHLSNPAVSALGLANIGLASLVLCAAFFSPGGLPAAFGLHVGWNAGLALAADAPVSGLRLGLPVVEFLPGPRPWLTGGAFGPEGGAAATVVLLGALAWWAGRQRGREVAA